MKIQNKQSHHSETATSDADKKLGDELASVIGDTFIDFKTMPPSSQWATIAKALRHHGLKIADKGKK